MPSRDPETSMTSPFLFHSPLPAHVYAAGLWQFPGHVVFRTIQDGVFRLCCLPVGKRGGGKLLDTGGQLAHVDASAVSITIWEYEAPQALQESVPWWITTSAMDSGLRGMAT